jgi:hypothetical protein
LPRACSTASRRRGASGCASDTAGRIGPNARPGARGEDGPRDPLERAGVARPEAPVGGWRPRRPGEHVGQGLAEGLGVAAGHDPALARVEPFRPHDLGRHDRPPEGARHGEHAALGDGVVGQRHHVAGAEGRLDLLARDPLEAHVAARLAREGLDPSRERLALGRVGEPGGGARVDPGVGSALAQARDGARQQVEALVRARVAEEEDAGAALGEPEVAACRAAVEAAPIEPHQGPVRRHRDRALAHVEALEQQRALGLVADEHAVEARVERRQLVVRDGKDVVGQHVVERRHHAHSRAAQAIQQRREEPPMAAEVGGDLRHHEVEARRPQRLGGPLDGSRLGRIGQRLDRCHVARDDRVGGAREGHVARVGEARDLGPQVRPVVVLAPTPRVQDGDAQTPAQTRLSSKSGYSDSMLGFRSTRPDPAARSEAWNTTCSHSSPP